MRPGWVSWLQTPREICFGIMQGLQRNVMDTGFQFWTCGILPARMETISWHWWINIWMRIWRIQRIWQLRPGQRSMQRLRQRPSSVPMGHRPVAMGRMPFSMMRQKDYWHRSFCWLQSIARQRNATLFRCSSWSRIFWLHLQWRTGACSSYWWISCRLLIKRSGLQGQP